jgi:hypothetical protein
VLLRSVCVGDFKFTITTTNITTTTDNYNSNIKNIKSNNVKILNAARCPFISQTVADQTNKYKEFFSTQNNPRNM